MVYNGDENHWTSCTTFKERRPNSYVHLVSYRLCCLPNLLHPTDVSDSECEHRSEGLQGQILSAPIHTRCHLGVRMLRSESELWRQQMGGGVVKLNSLWSDSHLATHWCEDRALEGGCARMVFRKFSDSCKAVLAQIYSCSISRDAVSR